MPALTEKEVHVFNLREKARILKLKAPDAFWTYPIGLLAETYNGAGPEWMNSVMRKALTFALREFEPAILGHDYCFEFSDGTKESFDLANKELFSNCVTLARADYAWYDPLRYKWLFRAFVMWRACAEGGWSAWVDAYNKPKEILA